MSSVQTTFWGGGEERGEGGGERKAPVQACNAHTWRGRVPFPAYGHFLYVCCSGYICSVCSGHDRWALQSILLIVSSINTFKAFALSVLHAMASGAGLVLNVQLPVQSTVCCSMEAIQSHTHAVSLSRFFFSLFSVLLSLIIFVTQLVHVCHGTLHNFFFVSFSLRAGVWFDMAWVKVSLFALNKQCKLLTPPVHISSCSKASSCSPAPSLRPTPPPSSPNPSLSPLQQCPFYPFLILCQSSTPLA